MTTTLPRSHLVGLALAALSFLTPVASAADALGVRCVTFSPDGKRLAVTTGEPKERGSVTLWDVAPRKQIWEQKENTGVPAAAFSPDGRTLAVGIYGNAAKLLDADTGKVNAVLKHPKEVRAVAFSPDGTRLATACWDKRVRVWDVGTAAEKVICTGHRDRLFSVAFSPDGKRLLSAGGDDGAKLWDGATGVEKRTFKHYFMPCALFSPDGDWVITGSYDGTTRLWGVESGEARVRFDGTGGVHALAFSQAARTLAVCGYGRDISLFDLTFAQPNAKDRRRVRALLAQLDDDSYDVREAAGKSLLASGFVAEAELRRAVKEAPSVEVRIRARRLRQELLSRPRAVLRGHTGEVASVSFSPDGKVLASGGKDGTVRLWDLASRKEIARLVPGR